MVRKLTSNQRQVVAEKFMEWGNLVFVALVVGQGLAPIGFIIPVAIVGVGLFAASYAIALRYMRGGE